MSYIRSTSNPEGLYIWHDVSEDIMIHWNQMPPLCSKQTGMAIPAKVFYKAVEKAKWGEKTTVDGFTIEEQYIFMDTGKKVPTNHDIFREQRKLAYQIKLSYKNRFVFLWKVTWRYVVDGVLASKSFWDTRKTASIRKAKTQKGTKNA